MTTTNESDTGGFLVPEIAKLLARGSRGPAGTGGPQAQPSPWLTVKEAAERARCGTKLIYREVTAGRLQAARVGGRRELRFRAEWIDDWLLTHRVIK